MLVKFSISGKTSLAPHTRTPHSPSPRFCGAQNNLNPFLNELIFFRQLLASVSTVDGANPFSFWSSSSRHKFPALSFQVSSRNRNRGGCKSSLESGEGKSEIEALFHCDYSASLAPFASLSLYLEQEEKVMIQ
jgi:hypothetical protein